MYRWRGPGNSQGDGEPGRTSGGGETCDAGPGRIPGPVMLEEWRDGEPGRTPGEGEICDG